MDAAERYARFWKEDSSKRGLPADLSATDLLALPGVVRADEAAPARIRHLRRISRSSLWSKRHSPTSTRRRSREGAALSLTFEEILLRIDKGVSLLDAARAGISDRIVASLRERIAKLAAGVPLDEARLAQEVALLADRADITEEIDRLKTHLAEVAAAPRGARIRRPAPRPPRAGAPPRGQHVRLEGARGGRDEARPRPEVRARVLQGTGPERRMRGAR